MFRHQSTLRIVCVCCLAGLLALVPLCGCSPPAASSTSTGWQTYSNADGDSSVVQYESGSDFVRVRFSDGSVYLYTYASAGQANIVRMKQLAASGDGLNSFIMSNVRKKYESKQ